MVDFLEQRRRLVAHLSARGIRDARVLHAMGEVPREEFVLPRLRAAAYEDRALPIDCEQTISQPYVVALMIEALQLKSTDRVLEVGAGSGYSAAVLARMVREVFAIERRAELVASTTRRLSQLGITQVTVRCGDGTLGWQEHAPYDAISVTAGGPHIPTALKEQLAIGGRLVIPVGENSDSQILLRLTRQSENDFFTDDLGGVRFVPLIGEQGWRE